VFASTTHIRRFTAVAGLSLISVLSIGGLAQAQTSGASNIDKTRPAPLTGAQQACLTGKGVTLPTAPAPRPAGTTQTRPTPPTDAQRAAMDAAATACGVTLPAHGGHGGRDGGGKGPQLTAEQQACLTSQGITLPANPAAGASRNNTTGTKPARTAPTSAEQAARDAADTACGIVRPQHGTKSTATPTAAPTTAKAA
jgi:hypothetical protein